MKKIIFLLLVFIAQQTFATTYYFSATGSDANNGLTTGAPKQTLTAARGLTLAADDQILFNRGDIFRGYYAATNSGSSGHPIIYGAYGTGANPIISGAKNLPNTSDWINFSGNVWKTSTVVGSLTSPSYYYNAKDISNVIFNNDGFCGIKKQLYTSLATQGDYYMGTGDTLYLYSVSNPGSFYTNIEVAGVYQEQNFNIASKSYLTIQNITFKYSGNNNIAMTNADNIIINHCSFIFTGGWYAATDGTRQGNGIQLWQTNSNIEIKNNYIFESYDAGISPQGSTTAYTQSNINMHNNLIVNAYYSYELFLRTSSTFSNIKFDNNTCIGAGRQWSQNQRPNNVDAEHIRQVISSGTISGCSIRNNIFYDGTVRNAQMDVTTGMVCDYNLIYGLPIIGKWNGATETTISQWRTASGFDVNSLNVTPILNPDYTLQVTSPARGAGINVGYGTDLGAFPYVVNTNNIIYGIWR